MEHSGHMHPSRSGAPSRQEGALRIAVTGASGRIGGQVVRLLAAGQPHQVIALSRRGLSPGRWPPRVSARAADYADPQALGAALRDVDTLVFVSSDGPVAEVMVHHQNVIRAARDSGVGHIVALSGLDADLTSPFCYAVRYGYTERLLAESGCAVFDRQGIDLQRGSRRHAGVGHPA